MTTSQHNLTDCAHEKQCVRQDILCTEERGNDRGNDTTRGGTGVQPLVRVDPPPGALGGLNEKRREGRR